MMVRMAAMNVWSTSRLNGRIPENNEKKPITMIAVWASETTPPRPHVQPLNRKAMYAKITNRERMTAMMASLFMSLAIVGPTLSDEMIPLGLSTVDLNSSSVMSVSAKNGFKAL